MKPLLDNPRFAEAYRRLVQVQLNPRRHTAANACAHSEAVAARAVALALLNALGESATSLLENLGRAHDIGKITGTAKPERSLEVLHDSGIDDPVLLALVKWHDTSLPWYRASEKGQPPSDKAWRRLAAEVDLRLLALFMVADRVDAPAGWRRNAPTRWFLQEARARGLLGELELDLPDQPSEIAAGGVLLRRHDGADEVLLLGSAAGYELPYGAIEWDELPSDAAVRQMRHSAGVESELRAGRELGHVDRPGAHLLRVRYFALDATAPVRLGARERERRFVRLDELATVPLRDDAVRALLGGLLTPETRCTPAGPDP